MKNYDVIIAGNGVLAYTSAFFLNRMDDSLKIGIIAPSHRNGSATIAAGAMLGTYGELTRELLASQYGIEKHVLAIESNQIWPSLIETLNANISPEKSIRIHKGTYIISNTVNGFLEDENFQAIKSTLLLEKSKFKENLPCKEFGLDPQPDVRPTKSIYIPDENFIFPGELLDAYENYFKQTKNISLIDDVVLIIETSKSEKKITTSLGQSFYTKNLVLAAGAATQSLLSQLPIPNFSVPKLLAGVGMGVLIELPNHGFTTVVRTPNRAGACGLHLVPRSEHILYLGASNFLSDEIETKATISYLFHLLGNAIKQFKQQLHQAKILNVIVGNRPVAIDAFPLFGEIGEEGIWVLSGTYRDGIHLSPSIAHRFAQAFLKQRDTISSLFLPQRDFISTMTPTESIDLAVSHYMSAGYEHNISFPDMGWSDLFEDLIKQKIENLYKSLDIQIGLPPELLIMLSKDKNLKKADALRPYFTRKNKEYDLI